MSKTITLDKDYGLNHSLDHCIVCGESTNIIIFGNKYRDKNGKRAQAPRDVCTGDVCDKCRKLLDKGHVAIIEVTDNSDENNISTTGRTIMSSVPVPDRKHPIAYMRHSDFSTLVKDN